MTKKDKLLNKVFKKPKDLTWNELVAFLSLYGYEAENSGKTSGSARRFINNKTKHSFCLHKPHNPDIVKSYAIDIVLGNLKQKGLLK
ncbi:MAG: hypothetical protein A2039_03020 [Candidatus Melainabacteria bacterium GWA2_34_9]|nr:MAG: hypothetical protein A2039_03020 [Candidatus Melainabacteria bacterium GWA2_34_9]